MSLPPTPTKLAQACSAWGTPCRGSATVRHIPLEVALSRSATAGSRARKIIARFRALGAEKASESHAQRPADREGGVIGAFFFEEFAAHREAFGAAHRAQ